MAEKYTGKGLDRRYKGAEADVTYSLRRCIHAEYCVRHLAQVFDASKRPWIDAEAASPDELSEVIPNCPSGALHLERKDGLTERVPLENTLQLWQNGPIQVKGDLTIEGATVDVHSETRATLCRCGASHNKPFCDNSHRDIGFEADDSLLQPGNSEPLEVTGGELKINPETNGPFHIEGNLTITNAAGEVVYAGTDAFLCRCGHSSHKPFCDGTHETIGFQAE